MNKTPEELINKSIWNARHFQETAKVVSVGEAVTMAKEYGDQQWNAALEAAAASVTFVVEIDENGNRYQVIDIDKQSILSLKR